MPVARTTNKPSVVVVQKLEWSEFSPAEVRTEVVGVFPDRSAAAFVVDKAVTSPEPGWVKVTALHMENGSLRRSYTITEYEVQDNLPARREAAAERAVTSHEFLYDVTDRGSWRQDGDEWHCKVYSEKQVDIFKVTFKPGTAEVASAEVLH
jgi:hypothetical protein